MPSPAINWLMIFAMPTAKVGAPPARDKIVFSPTFFAISSKAASVTGKPILSVMTCAALAASVPIKAAGLFIAKYTPGSSELAAANAIIATKLSIIMPP